MENRSLFTCFLFICIAALVYSQSDLSGATFTCYNRVKTPAPRTNTNCDWYNENACCTPYDTLGYDVTTIRNGGCAGPVDKRCTDYIVLFNCALVCSTNLSQASILEPGVVPQIRICSELAENIWTKCKYSAVKEWTKGVCVPLNTVWRNASDFVFDALNMVYDNSTTDKQSGLCWNSSFSLGPSWSTVTIFFFLLSLFSFIFQQSS
eukprot:TRINITY_DN1627_c0_g1_i1.p1 TRINITY_DN1627_c0_g1~~TRINITY_DN1627_c0_g1_i1.p1  ORF type:complete len:207 (-),score=32.37 TRINITY_DN1627_c0_g1_i1:43-663(-)